MTFSFEVIRPDDLLRLHMEARNLRIDRPQGQAPALVVEDADQPAFLIVHFQPQAIAEGGYYEATILQADVPPDAEPQPPPTTIGTVDPPGKTPVRIGRGSRLAFKVPAEGRIPFTVEGVLDWSGLALSVNGIAAIGPAPTPAEIAAAPAIARPRDTETALELPYRLIVSPTAKVSWGHRRAAFTSRGRTELWHTRLQLPGQGARLRTIRALGATCSAAARDLVARLRLARARGPRPAARRHGARRPPPDRGEDVGLPRL